jgi:hypothetical protein
MMVDEKWIKSTHDVGNNDVKQVNILDNILDYQHLNGFFTITICVIVHFGFH